MAISEERSERALSLVICGAAGQGIKTVEEILTRVLKRSGLHVFASREYMSRVRGGSNSTAIRISSEEVRALVDRIDILVILSPGIRPNVRDRISSSTIVIGDAKDLGDELSETNASFVDLPLAEEAAAAGGTIYAGSIAAGVVLGLLKTEWTIVERYFKMKFASKGRSVTEKNITACRRGMDRGEELLASGRISIGRLARDDLDERIMIDGTDAISLGALAGGCTFLSSYPMSPATGVLTFMARNAARFGTIVEQAEDEIAAINMALGAAYTGASAMVTTSGGGFDLMSEGLSLAAIAELPLVIHVGQRPGPATGMATRTEQADLELVIYSGHGEYPRIVLAPGTLEEAFELTRRAFDLAEEFQTQVILLTDQYFLNSLYDISSFDLSARRDRPVIARTSKNYRRYEDFPSGISPRGLPGWGDAIVGCDSHEHDEVGHVYEDFDLRIRMERKRFRKASGMAREILPPLFIGPEEYAVLVICWGSTFPIVKEAIERLERDDVALLHYRQVHPLPDDIVRFMRSAKRTIVVEGNFTGQFAAQIRLKTGIDVDDRILNYRGTQFSVEEIECKLEEILDREEG